VSFQITGRKCNCGGDLRDTVLDWEDDLPEEDWEMAQDQCERSDLVLVLGSSLRIEPVGSLPTLAKQFVIVNKQVTPYDDRAALIIRANVDKVFEILMENLNIRIP
jgi:mono-ADP-ribosyltransferase sirtuin 6